MPDRKSTSDNEHVVLNVSRKMKLGDPAAQCDIQSIGSDGKLDDVWVRILIRQRLGTTNLTRISLPFGRRVHRMDSSLMRLGIIVSTIFAGDPPRLVARK